MGVSPGVILGAAMMGVYQSAMATPPPPFGDSTNAGLAGFKSVWCAGLGFEIACPAPFGLKPNFKAGQARLVLDLASRLRGTWRSARSPSPSRDWGAGRD